jgi:hypothetical protein
MVHDTPVMLYLSFLIDRYHEVPYRDFFDENMPGVYLTYYLVGKAFGYTDIGFRCADMLYLAAILGATWLWMRRIDRRAGWCGALLFGLVYLGHGPVISLQKDYVILLPTALALLAASQPRFGIMVRSVLIGFLFGMCALIKPQAAIGLPLVLAFAISDVGREGRIGLAIATRLIGAAAVSLAGFAVPLVAAGLYLWRNGALGSFIDIARNYWPLYHELTGYKMIATGALRVKYLFLNFIDLGGMRLWLLPATVGVCVALVRSGLTASQKRRVKLLIGLLICYGVYVLLAGKFWPYHWLPFSYFIILLSSLCVIKQPQERGEATKRFPVVILFMTACLTVRPPHDFLNQIRGEPPTPPKDGRVDEIAAYLKSNLREGDRVQPIEGAGGALQAMLMTEVRLATPFYYDTCFYHHITSPYIQGLRRQFIESLSATAPRFVVWIDQDVPWFFGEDTWCDFPELRFLLDTRYRVVFRGRHYEIYERL